MNKFSHYLGIDVSKTWVDACLADQQERAQPAKNRKPKTISPGLVPGFLLLIGFVMPYKLIYHFLAPFYGQAIMVSELAFQF